MLLTAFTALVAAALLFDLGFANRRQHAPSVKEAALNSLAWVGVACVWGLALWQFMGAHAAGLYFTAYLMEKSLSVDNLFVFSLIFSYFGIQNQYRHKVLYWGIIGAVILRVIMISAGVQLVATFSWLLYLFGAFLLYAGYKMFTQSDDEPQDVGNSLAVRIAKHLFPMWSGEHSGKFMVWVNHSRIGIPHRMATRMFLALVAVELADVIFAVDSIPVVVAFTQDFTIAFTSNLMAILGLRSLFFLLDHLLARLVYLQYALGFALSFIGFKMVIAYWVHIPTGWSITAIVGALGVATAASVWATRNAT